MKVIHIRQFKKKHYKKMKHLNKKQFEESKIYLQFLTDYISII